MNFYLFDEIFFFSGKSLLFFLFSKISLSACPLLRSFLMFFTVSLGVFAETSSSDRFDSSHTVSEAQRVVKRTSDLIFSLYRLMSELWCLCHHWSLWLFNTAASSVSLILSCVTDLRDVQHLLSHSRTLNQTIKSFLCCCYHLARRPLEDEFETKERLVGERETISSAETRMDLLDR